MTPPQFLAIAILVVMPVLIITLVVVVNVFAVRAKAAPLPADPEADVTFYARVVRAEQVPLLRGRRAPRLRNSPTTNGLLTLTVSHLIWNPTSGEQWVVPIPAISAGALYGTEEWAGAALAVEVEGQGSWRITVSDRPLTRYARASFARFREADAVRTFAQLLVSRGARVAA